MARFCALSWFDENWLVVSYCRTENAGRLCVAAVHAGDNSHHLLSCESVFFLLESTAMTRWQNRVTALSSTGNSASTAGMKSSRISKNPSLESAAPMAKSRALRTPGNSPVTRSLFLPGTRRDGSCRRGSNRAYGSTTLEPGRYRAYTTAFDTVLSCHFGVTVISSFVATLTHPRTRTIQPHDQTRSDMTRCS
jgi:hypothetical protein